MEIVVETVGEYTGMLYGHSSYSVFKNGKEIFHTEFRSINTKEELIEDLEKFPEFIGLLNQKGISNE